MKKIKELFVLKRHVLHLSGVFALLFGVSVVVSACSHVTESTDTSSAASNISTEESEELTFEIETLAISDVPASKSTLNETAMSSETGADKNGRAIIKTKLTAGYWHSDMDADGIPETSIRFDEDGVFRVESENNSFVEMDHWEFAENDENKLCLYNSQKKSEYLFVLTNESLTFDGMEFQSNPMHQLFICGKPLYVGMMEDYDSILPDYAKIHYVKAGGGFPNEVFFYYPGELKDFKIYELEYDIDTGVYWILDTTFAQDSVTKQEAVFRSGYFADLLINLGFTFVDSEGEFHSYTVHWDMTGENIHDPYYLVEEEMHER